MFANDLRLMNFPQDKRRGTQARDVKMPPNRLVMRCKLQLIFKSYETESFRIHCVTQWQRIQLHFVIRYEFGFAVSIVT